MIDTTKPLNYRTNALDTLNKLYPNKVATQAQIDYLANMLELLFTLGEKSGFEYARDLSNEATQKFLYNKENN